MSRKTGKINCREVTDDDGVDDVLQFFYNQIEDCMPSAVVVVVVVVIRMLLGVYCSLGAVKRIARITTWPLNSGTSEWSPKTSTQI